MDDVFIDGGLYLLIVHFGVCRLVGTQEWLYETRIRAQEGFNAEAEIAHPAVQGVPAMTGQHVVLGMPAELNVQSTVRMTMNFPERVIGKPMVGHDQQLRAAATAPAWS